ncbi:MAG TPA: YhcH/YjgK/YiaL family protein [Desulfuromonadales bacterium]|nr:YhcH/YjgK/YiaL family protein [Desulfuromonadales bacterium]
MIFDQLSNLPLYLRTHPQFAAAGAFLRSGDLDGLAVGRHEIGDDGAFALVSEYQTRPLAEGFIECHRRYLDIQLITRGAERVGICPRSTGHERPYDTERDFLVLEGDCDFLTLRPGAFMIFFPDDGHMPNLRLGEGAEAVKKIVLKIPAAPETSSDVK